MFAFRRHSWCRRLTFRGNVSKVLVPGRGIAAGAAGTTFELWLRLLDVMELSGEQHVDFILSVHAHDLFMAGKAIILVHP